MSDSEYSDDYDSDEDADYDPALEGIDMDDREAYLERYRDELQQLYDIMMTQGKCVFGEAFFQLGNYGTFAHFIYKYTTP